VYSVQVISQPLATNCTISAKKTDPLSDPIDTGILNQGMISFNSHLATLWAFSVQLIRKAFTHPEKVQTNSSKYLHPLAHGISVKSTIRFSKGVPPTLNPRVALWPLLGIGFGTQTVPLIYARELGDIKRWAKLVSRAVCPE
jgi:hypothetical protein